MPDIDQLMFATQARVMVRATDEALLTAARDRAPDPSIFDTYPPFFFQNEISSDRLDSYFTIMDPLTTLPNYARDAGAGVAVLIGHDSRSLPVGSSLTGTLETIGEVTRVTSDAYILSEPDTVAVVSRIRAGIAKDISVGFTGRRKGAKCICSICGLDMWRDWDCWHIPGFEYETNAEATKGGVGAKVMVLCTGLIVNGSLAEYSLVYDGATPGAAVLQAQKAAEAGRMTVDQERLIRQRYHISLPGKRIASPGFTGGSMGGETNGKESGAMLDERVLQALCGRAGVPSDLVGIARIEWLADEVIRLKPLATDGETYRTDLRAAATAEAVRAFGAAAAETYKTTIEGSPIALVKELTTAWRAIGDSVLKGGRKTIDEPLEGSQPWQPKDVSPPAELYQG